MSTMNRREAIKNSALFLGGILSSSTLSYVMGASPLLDMKASRGTPEFTSEERKVIARIADIIIPETDSPGALKAGLPDFIPMMVRDTFPVEEQSKFHEGLNDFNFWCEAEMGKSFLDLDYKLQHKAVEKIDQLVLSKETSSGESSLLLKQGKESSETEIPMFYRISKELTLLGFFTSEIGATETLRYVQIPGDYDGCMPYKSGDKAWASNLYFQ